MFKSNFSFAVIGLLLGSIVGFSIANSLARKARENGGEVVATRPSASAPSNQADANAPADNSTPKLSEAELKDAIAKTDARPEDIALQRNFGLALYRYASQVQDATRLPDAARFIKRAYDANPKDHDLTISLANVLFDIGQTTDPARFVEARQYYGKALELEPADANARTDLGLTYYFAKPSEPQRAIAEYRKSLTLDPRHELTLQNLATALITVGNQEEAEKRIAELQNINPSNPALSSLRAQLAQSRNASEK